MFCLIDKAALCSTFSMQATGALLIDEEIFGVDQMIRCSGDADVRWIVCGCALADVFQSDGPNSWWRICELIW